MISAQTEQGVHPSDTPPSLRLPRMASQGSPEAETGERKTPGQKAEVLSLSPCTPL